jgi:hypothetical protein
MLPWVPDRVEIYDEFEIDYHRYKWVVGVMGEGWYFAAAFYLERDEILDDGSEWAIKAHDELKKAFRNRETEPVSVNIYLGEN